MSSDNWAWAGAFYSSRHGEQAQLTASEVPAPYLYNAVVIDWHDGDTVSVDIDWGFHRHDLLVPIRLLGCNAAELKATAPDGARPGMAARAAAAALAPPGAPLVLQTARPDKYAPRIDAAVTYLLDGQPRDLVADLIAAQWVAPWDGTGKAPVPPWPRTVTP